MTYQPQIDYADHDAFRNAFQIWPCRYCLRTGAHFMGPGAADNYAGVYCSSDGCGKHLRWLAWPPTIKGEQKNKRRYKRMARLNDDRCHICLRTRTQLPPGVQLEDRHVIDRAFLIDEGLAPDLPENLGWICSTPCKGIEIALRAAFDHYITWSEVYGSVVGE